MRDFYALQVAETMWDSPLTVDDLVAAIAFVLIVGGWFAGAFQ